MTGCHPPRPSMTGCEPAEPGRPSMTGCEPAEPGRPSMTGCVPAEPRRPSMTGCVPDEPRLRGRKKKKVTWGENETRIIPARPEESQSRPSMTGCDVPSVQDNQVLAVEKPLRRRNVKKPKAPAQQPKVTLRDELAAKLKSRNVAPKASGIQRL